MEVLLVDISTIGIIEESTIGVDLVRIVGVGGIVESIVN